MGRNSMSWLQLVICSHRLQMTPPAQDGSTCFYLFLFFFLFLRGRNWRCVTHLYTVCQWFNRQDKQFPGIYSRKIYWRTENTITTTGGCFIPNENVCWNFSFWNNPTLFSLCAIGKKKSGKNYVSRIWIEYEFVFFFPFVDSPQISMCNLISLWR